MTRDEESRALMVKTFLIDQDTGLRSPLTNAEVGLLADDVLRLTVSLRDARHALRHLYPYPYAAPEQLDDYDQWRRAVVTAGLGETAHPCAHGRQPCDCDIA